MLLDAGAKVNETEGDGRTALHKAARHGNDKVAKMLLDNGAVVDVKNEDGMTPLHVAAMSGHEKVVVVLLEKGASTSARTNAGKTPLELAMSKGGPNVVAMLQNKQPTGAGSLWRNVTKRTTSSQGTIKRNTIENVSDNYSEEVNTIA
jgi:ankyrin repeat protein